MVYFIHLRYLLLTEQSVCALYSRFMVRVFRFGISDFGLERDGVRVAG